MRCEDLSGVVQYRQRICCVIGFNRTVLQYFSVPSALTGPPGANQSSQSKKYVLINYTIHRQKISTSNNLVIFSESINLIGRL